MSIILERIYAAARPRRRWLLLWIATGIVIHACLPTLHSAMTPVGPAGLWLWALPLAALGLDLLAAPADALLPAPLAAPTARRRRSGTVRSHTGRHDRPRSARPDMRQGRRAGRAS